MIVTIPSGDAADATWIDLYRPSAGEIATVERATGLRVPTESQISEIESTSRLAFESGAFYLSAPLVARHEDGEHALTPVGFVLSSRVLLTVRFGPLASIDAARDEGTRKPPKSAEEALLHIFELVVDRSADALERTGAECDELARTAFRARAPRGGPKTDLAAALRKVGDVAERVSRVRDALLALGRIAAYLGEGSAAGAPSVSAARLKAVRADIASLADYEGHLSGKVQFLLDATLGFINIEQNDIVKTLTIASVVGIPPVLVVGIYGMNFRNMPELNWSFGYPMALALVVITSLLPLWWFRRRGWV
jgi:magnesium transporter